MKDYETEKILNLENDENDLLRERESKNTKEYCYDLSPEA